MKRLIMTAAALLALTANAAPVEKKLTPPTDGPIPVAIVITEHATVIDFAGPWEVFQDAWKDDKQLFKLYTVSDTRTPIHASAGLTIVPDYTFDDAPAPRVVVVGAQMGKSEKMLNWLRKASTDADVLMSVCTGAFKLGAAGLLDGKPATTHHDFFEQFAKANPKAQLVRGRRYVVSDPTISTAGGLTSGIDLALHVVERYFGRATAEQTATYMEYESTGWKQGDAKQPTARASK